MNHNKGVRLKDVAQKANVSTSTVSHVINQTRHVNPETEKKVRDAIEELGYQANYIARTLRRNKSDCIGVILPDISHEFFFSFLKGVEGVLFKQGYNIILSNSHENCEIERRQLDSFLSMQVDGMILAPSARELPLLNHSAIQGKPVVCIDRVPDHAVVDTVLPDNEAMIHMVVEHLIARGHRNIAFVTTDPELYPCRIRVQAYRRFLADYGLQNSSDMVFYTYPEVEAGEKIAQQILYQTDATAVFVDNLNVSVGIQKYLIENKIPIPQRLAIMGCNDSIWATIANPSLTSIHVKATEMGAVAAKLLLARIQNPQKGIEQITLPLNIVVRGST